MVKKSESMVQRLLEHMLNEQCNLTCGSVGSGLVIISLNVHGTRAVQRMTGFLASDRRVWFSGGFFWPEVNPFTRLTPTLFPGSTPSSSHSTYTPHTTTSFIRDLGQVSVAPW